LEVLGILAVTLDQDLVIGAPEMVTPLLHCLNNLQECQIVCVIVLFSGRVFSRVQIHWAKNPESVLLVEDAGDCEAAFIGLPNDLFLGVEMLQDWCACVELFELSMCEFGIPSPFPLPLALWFSLIDMGAVTIVYFRINL
jgi:hypothetical protein